MSTLCYFNFDVMVINFNWFAECDIISLLLIRNPFTYLEKNDKAMRKQVAV